jgi:hypothetical protein
MSDLQSVDDPGHLAGASAKIRGGHVNAGANEVALDELNSVAAGDLLELVHGHLLGVDNNATLATSKRNIHEGALPGHERSQSLDLILVDHGGVTNTSLAEKC